MNYNNIPTKEYCCPVCLTGDILEALMECDEYESVSVYADADLISDLLKILLTSTVDDREFRIGVIDFDAEGFDYELEYVLTINEDFSLWIEPAYRLVNGKWTLFNSESYITFVDDGCDLEVIKKLQSNKEDYLVFCLDVE